MPEIKRFYAVERQKITREQLRPVKSPKPKGWSHEDELQAHKGKRIAVVMAGAREIFTLLEADRFALKLGIQNGEGGQSTVTVYKHAISGYSLLTE